MATLLVRNLQTMITCDDSDAVLNHVDLYCEDGVIRAIGPNLPQAADTGQGHGTDRALVAGLLGMKPDDLGIPESFAIAANQGLEFRFHTIHLRDAHPNTAVLEVESADGRKLTLQAASTGGGRIRVDQLDGVDVSFTGIFNTLVVRHQDVAGELSRILNELSVSGVNIANMSLNRDRRGGDALTVVETDQRIPQDALERIRVLYGVLGATYYEKEAE